MSNVSGVIKSIQDIMRRHVQYHGDIRTLPDLLGQRRVAQHVRQQCPHTAVRFGACLMRLDARRRIAGSRQRTDDSACTSAQQRMC